MEIIFDILIKSIFASIASTGFAMLFNVPKHTLIFCAIGGGITYIIRNVSMELGLSILFNLSTTPNVILASSVLLLVPGVPFVNSFLDSFKGYLSMGWGRWLQAMILTIASSSGIVLAMSILNIKGW